MISLAGFKRWLKSDGSKVNRNLESPIRQLSGRELNSLEDLKLEVLSKGDIGDARVDGITSQSMSFFLECNDW